MDVLEIKHDLMQLLVETNDAKLLAKVRDYFKRLSEMKGAKESEEVPEALLEAQEDAMIELGLHQIETGKVMPHEEAVGRIRGRFKHLGK